MSALPAAAPALHVRQKMIVDCIQLGSVLERAASRVGAAFQFDTHFEAQNWQLSWWTGCSLHRLDFQPVSAQSVSVTHYEDHFRGFPRLLRWAHSVVPYFPYLARIECRRSHSISLPVEETELITLVDRAVSTIDSR
jgi:hypothetical protein